MPDNRSEKDIQETDKKGEFSLFNFKRTSTKLAFLVGIPIYLYLHIEHNWGMFWGLMLTLLPTWMIFYLIESFLVDRKIKELSDTALINLASEEFKDQRAEEINMAINECKKRGLTIQLDNDNNKKDQSKRKQGIKLYAISLLLLLIASSTLYASDWLLAGVDPKIYFDIDSLRYEKNEVVFWQKSLHSSGDYDLIESSINCGERTVRLYQLMFYNSAGVVKKRINFKESGHANKSQSIPPETNIETIYQFLCKNGAVQKPGKVRESHSLWLKK